MPFEIAEKRTTDIEGKYSDHPSDKGGKTMYGITENVARAFGYGGPMQMLPLATAKKIYKQRYWDLQRLDDVDALSPAIAYEMYDTGVNAGISRSVRWLQESLNLLNRQAKDYDDITEDGVMGPLTVHTLRRFLARRGKDGERVLLTSLNVFQGQHYRELARQDPSQEDFYYGWLRTRVVMPVEASVSPAIS